MIERPLSTLVDNPRTSLGRTSNMAKPRFRYEIIILNVRVYFSLHFFYIAPVARSFDRFLKIRIRYKFYFIINDT